jgi:hypothetical protein
MNPAHSSRTFAGLQSMKMEVGVYATAPALGPASLIVDSATLIYPEVTPFPEPRSHPNRALLSPTHVRDQPLARINLRIRIMTAFGFLASLVACTNPQWIQATHYDGVQPVPGPPSLRRLAEMQTEGPIEKQWVLAHR